MHCARVSYAALFRAVFVMDTGETHTETFEDIKVKLSARDDLSVAARAADISGGLAPKERDAHRLKIAAATEAAVKTARAACLFKMDPHMVKLLADAADSIGCVKSAVTTLVAGLPADQPQHEFGSIVIVAADLQSLCQAATTSLESCKANTSQNLLGAVRQCRSCLSTFMPSFEEVCAEGIEAVQSKMLTFNGNVIVPIVTAKVSACLAISKAIAASEPREDLAAANAEMADLNVLLRTYLAVSQVVSVLAQAIPAAKGQADKDKLRKDLKGTLSSEANSCVKLPDAVQQLYASHFDA